MLLRKWECQVYTILPAKVLACSSSNWHWCGTLQCEQFNTMFGCIACFLKDRPGARDPPWWRRMKKHSEGSHPVSTGKTSRSLCFGIWNEHFGRHPFVYAPWKAHCSCASLAGLTDVPKIPQENWRSPLRAALRTRHRVAVTLMSSCGWWRKGSRCRSCQLRWCWHRLCWGTAGAKRVEKKCFRLLYKEGNSGLCLWCTYLWRCVLHVCMYMWELFIARLSISKTIGQPHEIRFWDRVTKHRHVCCRVHDIYTVKILAKMCLAWLQTKTGTARCMLHPWRHCYCSAWNGCVECYKICLEICSAWLPRTRQAPLQAAGVVHG